MRFLRSFSENPTTERCSDEAFCFWMGRSKRVSWISQKEGVFRYPWRVLDANQLLSVHNAVTRFPIYEEKRRRRLFNQLRELNLIELRARDRAYFIRAAFHAQALRKPTP